MRPTDAPPLLEALQSATNYRYSGMGNGLQNAHKKSNRMGRRLRMPLYGLYCSSLPQSSHRKPKGQSKNYTEELIKPKPLSLEKFKEAQAFLISNGRANDPCGKCGCRRDMLLPTPTFSYAKTGGSSGKSRELPVLAPTSCD